MDTTKEQGAGESPNPNPSHNLQLIGAARYAKERKAISNKLRSSRHFYWQAQGRARGATKIGQTLWQVDGAENFIASSVLATVVADSAQSWYGLP